MTFPEAFSAPYHKFYLKTILNTIDTLFFLHYDLSIHTDDCKLYRRYAESQGQSPLTLILRNKIQWKWMET